MFFIRFYQGFEKENKKKSEPVKEEIKTETKSDRETPKLPTAAELERNLVTVEQDLTEVKVGPEFLEEDPEMVPEHVSERSLPTSVVQPGDVETSNPDRRIEADSQEKADSDSDECESDDRVSEVESQSEVASTVTNADSQAMSSQTAETVVTMLPDDVSDLEEEEPTPSRTEVLDKKIKNLKRFLSARLRKRFETVSSVRRDMECPKQPKSLTKVKSKKQKKKVDKKAGGKSVSDFLNALLSLNLSFIKSCIFLITITSFTTSFMVLEYKFDVQSTESNKISKNVFNKIC